MSIAELEQTVLRYMEFKHFALDKALAEVQGVLRLRFKNGADWTWHTGGLDYRIIYFTVEVRPFSAFQHCVCTAMCTHLYACK